MNNKIPQAMPDGNNADTDSYLSSPDYSRGAETAESLAQNVRMLEENQTRLLQQMTKVTDEHQDLMVRCVRLEEQNATLATLYVACQRLHHSLDRSEVMLSVREILANLIGCEQYALILVGPDGKLRLADSWGIDQEEYECSVEIIDRFKQVIQSGKPYWAEEINPIGSHVTAEGLTACIPLRHNSALTGVLALFRLLPQKFELQESDYELLQLLEAQLATTLYCADLHEKQTICMESSREI